MAVQDVFCVIDGKGHAATKSSPRALRQCTSCEVVVCCAAKPISERPSNRQRGPRTACPITKPGPRQGHWQTHWDYYPMGREGNLGLISLFRSGPRTQTDALTKNILLPARPQ